MSKSVSYFFNKANNYFKRICNEPNESVVGFAEIPGNEDGNAIKKDILYCGTDKEFFQLSPSFGSYVILMTLPEAPPAKSTCNILLFDNEEAYRDFIARTNEILLDEVRLASVSNSMAHIIQSSHSLRTLMEYAFSLLGNPLMVSDVSFNYIDSVGTESIQNEEIWDYAIKNNTFPEIYISSLISRFFSNQSEKKQKIMMVDEAGINGLSHTQYSVSVFLNGNILGFVKLLEYNKHPSDFELEILQTLATYVGFVLSNFDMSALNATTLNENFIEAILCNRISKVNEIKRKQALLNLKLLDNLFAISVMPTANEALSENNYYLYKELRSFFIGCNVVVLKSHFFVLYDQKAPYLSEEFLTRFKAFLDANACVANISLCFSNFEELNRFYEQTLFCNEIRSCVSPQKTIVLYEEVYSMHMIASFGRQTDLKSLVSPVLKKLILEDQSFGSNLVETLFVFLDSLCNVATTAKKLEIHYNTVKNRIQRIQEITGMDFEDSGIRFNLELSRRIMNFLNDK